MNLWEAQEEIALALLDHRRVAVASCYGAGKTFLAAVAAIWWLCSRRPALVVTTAPTGRQVKKLLWRELRKLWSRAKRRLPGKRPLQVEWVISDDWQAFGFSADNPTGAQGVHEVNTLVIEDEASGIDSDLSNTLDGAMVDPSCRRLKIGNPILSDGAFFDSFHKCKNLWWTKHISVFDCPNVREGRIVIPGAVDMEWVEGKRLEYGEESNYWRTVVLGQFPKDQAEKCIPMDWIRLAQERWHQMEDGEPHVVGGDIGRGRDKTAIGRMLGRRVHLGKVWQEPDTMRAVAELLKEIERIEATRAAIDETAVGGGVVDRLRELQREGRIPECKIRGANLSCHPKKRLKFSRLGDELWWQVRDALNPDPRVNPDPIGLPPDEELAQQLNCRMYDTDAKGRIKVETKNDLRKRGVKSPDKADMVALLLFRPKEIVAA